MENDKKQLNFVCYKSDLSIKLWANYIFYCIEKEKPIIDVIRQAERIK